MHDSEKSNEQQEIAAEIRAAHVSTDRSLALMHVSRLLNSTLDLGRLLEQVMDIVIEALRAERGFLMLFRGDGPELEYTVARNMDRRTLQQSESEISRSIVREVVHTAQPILTSNAQMDPRFAANQSIIDFRLRSILCVPLRMREKVIGVIYVDNRIKAGIFNEKDRDFLVSFSHLAAVAIQNATLFRRLQANLAETKRLKRLMDNTFASIASGVLTVGPDGRISMINRAAQKMTGIAGRQASGERLADIFPWLVAHPMPVILASVAGGQESVLTIDVTPTIPGRGTSHFRVTVSRLSGEAAGSVVIALEDLTEEVALRQEREREAHVRTHLQKMLQRYLSPAVAGRLANSPEALKLGGQRQEITVLFADLRGFTTLAETLPPEDLVNVLNRYLGIAVREIFDLEGTLDKFLGDAIMAIFNAPFQQPDHILRGLQAALRIRESIQASWKTFPEDLRLNVGIAVNVGEAVVGNIGSEDRMDFTAVGDCVNIAERLEELAEPGQILITHDVYERTRDLIEVRASRSVSMRGRKTSTLAYEFIGFRSE